MGKVQIEKIIPHRPPFLMVDEIVDLIPGSRAVGVKRVVSADCLLPSCGGKKAMPGVLVLEAMAQVGSVAVLSLPEHRGKITLLAGIDNAHFYGELMPGEEIRIEAEITRIKKGFGRRRCLARVGEKLVAEADLLFFLAHKPWR